MIHHAIVLFEEETFNFVSLDGDYWLPVSRGPVPSDHEEDIERLFRGDGNFMPMTMGRRWLEHYGADFKTEVPSV
jgi:hypothetical protein